MILLKVLLLILHAYNFHENVRLYIIAWNARFENCFVTFSRFIKFPWRPNAQTSVFIDVRKINYLRQMTNPIRRIASLSESKKKYILNCILRIKREPQRMKTSWTKRSAKNARTE